LTIKLTQHVSVPQRTERRNHIVTNASCGGFVVREIVQRAGKLAFPHLLLEQTCGLLPPLRCQNRRTEQRS
jgi:hypothetical protein